MLGMGNGQPNHLESLRISMRKAGDEVKGASLASDAFFPIAWNDTVEKVCEASIGLTRVFICSMIVSLVQLNVLRILFCEELEQIIAKDDDENDHILLGDHLRSLCFPNLCEIDVRKCNKLKSLFPVAMTSGLLKLQILKVSEASQLFGVFVQDDHSSPINVKKEMDFLICGSCH